MSVCQDNSIAITTHSLVVPLFVGSCHHTSVLEIRWRLAEDILLVHCLGLLLITTSVILFLSQIEQLGRSSELADSKI